MGVGGLKLAVSGIWDLGAGVLFPYLPKAVIQEQDQITAKCMGEQPRHQLLIV